MIPQEHRSKIPDRIQKRLADLQSEIDEIVATARCKFLTEAPQRIGFTFSGSSKTGAGDLMSEYERAQSVAFVTRYDNLPEDMKTHLVEHEGRWMISNLWVLRHVLNDFRPLIHNQHDAVHYNHVHRTWFKMLQRADDKDGIMIRVRDENERDITTVYSQSLVENKQAISAVVNRLDFGYLYNGVLQHSDPKYTNRFWSDYTSGELNYLLLKHVRVLGFIKGLLKPYHTMMSFMTFPTLGGL